MITRNTSLARWQKHRKNSFRQFRRRRRTSRRFVGSSGRNTCPHATAAPRNGLSNGYLRRTGVKNADNAEIAIAICNGIYGIHKLFPVRNRIAMVSRQSSTLTLDMRLLKEELERQNPEVEILTLNRMIPPGLAGKIKYLWYMVTREMHVFATSRVVLLEVLHQCQHSPSSEGAFHYPAVARTGCAETVRVLCGRNGRRTQRGLGKGDAHARKLRICYLQQ